MEQRQLDLIGLGLIALGVIVAIPLLRAGTAGVVGEAIADGARLLLGAVALAGPFVLIGAGLVAVSPLGIQAAARIAGGATAALTGITLIARAAAGPDTGARWSTGHLRDAGGALGELAWSLSASAFGTFGTYVIAILLLAGAALLLTGAELRTVFSGAGRGLSRAIRAPGRLIQQRRADRALALDDISPSVVRATGVDPTGTHAAQAPVTSAGPATASGTRTAVRSAQPPRTWTSQGERPRAWSSADADPSEASSSSAVLPPEPPGAFPTVRRTGPALVDGAERFPDLYGLDGPILIGPTDEDAPRRPTGPFPDPLQEFDDELSAARAADGAPAPEDLELDASDDEDLPLERDGRFAEEEFDVPAVVLTADELPPVRDHNGIFDEDDAEDDEPSDDYDDDEPAPRGGPVGPEQLTPMGRYRAEVTEAADFPWKVPPSRLLTRSPRERGGPSRADQEQTATLLLEALGHFGVQAEMVGCTAGPHITRYELRLAPGVKMSKVSNLKDDLAYALAAVDIRILAPIPGKTAVGVEVPNRNRSMVRLGDVFGEAPPKASPLNVWLGKDVEGESIFVDLAKMPHLLVAGTTGAGKSACINGMLSSILLSASPHDVRMVLVDPKQVELTPYESIPHLLTPVITSPKMAATALQNLVREMEARYSTMALSRTRNLPELNRVRRERGEQEFPYILCVIDELADLMMVAPGEVEDSIIRIAQKARAVGIHLVLATQSPRVDVITGMIKANVPSRIAFAVSSQTDSRVILDQNGAESLLGQGDMLFSPVGSAKLQRIQGAYIDEEQIEQITGYWRRQGEPDFKEELLAEPVDAASEGGESGDNLDPDEDPMLEEAVRLVVEMGTASTSMMQRRLRVGYTRAGRLIDMLERRGVITGYEGSKARQVLIGPSEVERIVEQVRARGKAVEPPQLFAETGNGGMTAAAIDDEPSEVASAVGPAPGSDG